MKYSRGRLNGSTADGLALVCGQHRLGCRRDPERCLGEDRGEREGGRHAQRRVLADLVHNLWAKRQIERVCLQCQPNSVWHNGCTKDNRPGTYGRSAGSAAGRSSSCSWK